MDALSNKADIVQQLQKEILSLQGYGSVFEGQAIDTGLGPIEAAFPDKVFPIGAVHEFLSYAPSESAATSGFMAGLLSSMMRDARVCLWVSTSRSIFPPGLKAFGIDPSRIIFVDLSSEKDALWAIEEALKCKALAAVVGEVRELSFAQSRRLQLAVEQSRVNGFIHRHRPKTENPIACVSRWKISPLASQLEEGMPGIGHPRWNVNLLKVRNGRPGSWQLEWSDGSFKHVPALARTEASGDALKTA
jgi:protein ImuA